MHRQQFSELLSIFELDWWKTLVLIVIFIFWKCILVVNNEMLF